MEFRLVTLDDAEMLLEWRNDPITRAFSINQDVVEYDDHIAWLNRVLDDEIKDDCPKIAEVDGKPIGTIRAVQVGKEDYYLSWSIAPAARGNGYGTKMLQKLVDGFKSGTTFTALIKPDNVASVKMAEKVGFRLRSEGSDLNEYEMIKKRTDKEIIDEIEAIRAKNNTHWMDAVRMCFELAPERARALFQAIKDCDVRVTELTQELANNK